MKKLYQLWHAFWRKSRFNTQRPSLVLVTNQWENCKQEPERKICQYLHEHGYYPSLNYKLPYVCANVALVPCRIALIRTSSPTFEKKVSRQLERMGWIALFYDETHLTSDFLAKILEPVSVPAYRIQE